MFTWSNICKYYYKNKIFSRLKKIHNKMVDSKKFYHRVFSGIQPTGIPHLGNYFGAIRNWTKLQASEATCIFSIVDLHSITLHQDPTHLRNNIHLMTACLLACGIDPEVSILFLQSQVPQHAELAWILGCLTTNARLAHLPQFKEKSSEMKDVPLGLLIYPILQCSDILVYKADRVPVGNDQIQHIQLCQHLAKLFNNKFKKIFHVPDPLLDPTSAKVKSLRQPAKKMSKSDPDLKSRIELTDSPDGIREKIKKSVTDMKSEVTFEPEGRPGVSNLILLHSLSTGLSTDDICAENTNMDTGQYKFVVADAIIEHLNPIRSKIEYLLSNSDFLEKVLEEGTRRATEIAAATMVEVKDIVGLSISKKL